MSLINTVEPVCWANAEGAPATRERAAWKWQDGVRVPSRDETGRQLTERVPQGAQYGMPITGLRQANLLTSVKVMRYEGDEAFVRVSQGAGHDIGADNSYQRYMLDHKGRAEGWLQAGTCPVAVVMNTPGFGSKVSGHPIVSAEVREAITASRPCNYNTLGIKSPPCPHYLAEQQARWKQRLAGHVRKMDAQKSEDAKLLEGQLAVQKQQAEAMTAAVQGMAETVREIREERAAPVKGGK
jgi:hypothetical protein